jgi:hypothetical protein
LDADLAARIKGVRDLILIAGSGSDDSGRLGARGGGAGHRRPVSLAARGLGSPDFTVNGAPGVKSSSAWLCRDQRDTRNPPGALTGSGVLEVARAATEAGLRSGARRRAMFRLQERAKVYDI